jgi:hypothetical protein
MSNGIVGTEASQQRTGSEIYFQTYQELLRQKDKIDREILKMQSKFLKAISRNGTIPQSRATYVSRLENHRTLALAIRACMVPDKEMTMKNILKSLEKKNLYHTDSKYFYTMVNNKLNRDPHIFKMSRGVFMYVPSSRKRKAIEDRRVKQVVSKVV